MEDIRTYAVGNGEITLTAQDAEELRRLLQFEYIEHCINELIDTDPTFFHFTSEHNRPAFVRKVAERYEDIVNMEGGYLECLDEDLTYVARRVGVTDADEAIDDTEFSGFWKE